MIHVISVLQKKHGFAITATRFKQGIISSIDLSFIQCFNREMNADQHEHEIQQRLNLLLEHLASIRRNHEKVLAENVRLREVARLAEGELRKRRQQIEKLQLEQHSLESKRVEAKARIEKTIKKLDILVAGNMRQEG